MRTTFNKPPRRSLTLSAAALLAFLGLGFTATASAGGDQHDNKLGKLNVFGLTDDGRVVRFRSDKPERTTTVGFIAGLTGDTALIGIDFRVQDGKLYGVGNAGGVYTIDTDTAAATVVNALTIPLTGTFFGVDFNPAADRLRIVSDTGQNLAHNVNAGGVTVANETLTYTAPPAAPVAALGITGAAYTNNDLNQPATGTTLFDLDTALDQIVIQSPPGNGVLVATGKLGFDAGPQAGFDIYTQLRDGRSVANAAFAALSANGTSALFAIDLLTGTASLLGPFEETVVDIAIPLDQ